MKRPTCELCGTTMLPITDPYPIGTESPLIVWYCPYHHPVGFVSWPMASEKELERRGYDKNKRV